MDFSGGGADTDMPVKGSNRPISLVNRYFSRALIYTNVFLKMQLIQVCTCSSSSMQATRRTSCLRIPFLLPYAAVDWVCVCEKGDQPTRPDPTRLHGSLVRPVPQGEDPRASGVAHRHTQPPAEEGAAATWNPILVAHGPGHPHQLACGWWGAAAARVHITIFITCHRRTVDEPLVVVKQTNNCQGLF